jgi:hypothetical protein
MQQSLNLVTPYLPIRNSPKQRYKLLRPHVPSNFVLLWELLQGEHDFSIQDPHRLLVLVHSVESHIHHNLWTVELQDETGLTIRAWMEPKYVQEQILQEQHDTSTIRPGVVWMLRQVGMIVSSGEHDETLERMLLISGQQIEKIWTPEQAKQLQQHHQDSPQSQREFLDWMEKRKAIPLLDAEEEEEETSSRSSSHPEHQQEEQDDYHELSRGIQHGQEEEEDHPSGQAAAAEHNHAGQADWVQMLFNQRKTQGESSTTSIPPAGSDNIDETFHQTQEQVSASQQNDPSILIVRTQEVQDPVSQNDTSSMVHTPDKRPHGELLLRALDRDIQHHGGDSTLDSENAQKAKNDDVVSTTQLVGRRQHDESQVEEAASNKDRSSDLTTATTAKRRKRRQDMSQTEASVSCPRNHENVAESSFSQEDVESNVWNLQDTSMLHILDDEEDHMDQEKEKENCNYPPDLPSKLGNESYDPSQADQEDKSPEKEDLTQTRGVSVFDASSFQHVDISAFSDDD